MSDAAGATGPSAAGRGPSRPPDAPPRLATVSRPAASGDAAGERTPAPADARLAETASAWLAWQCRMIAGALQGVVILGDAGDQTPPEAVARWPDKASPPQGLVGAARTAWAEQGRVVRSRERWGRGGGELCDIVACPVYHGERPAGAVALALSIGGDAQQATVLRLLEWGAVWLESLVREEARLRHERNPALLALVALSTRALPFGVVATDVCNQLADHMRCQRAAIGFMHGLQARVVALSHTLRFDRRVSLVRAVEAAMEEAVDQGTPIVVPNADPEAAELTRAHAELMSRHGDAAVLTVLLRDADEVIGALTLERKTGGAFDQETCSLCMAAADLLGPVLALKRRESRPLAVTIIEALRDQARRLLGRGHLRQKMVAAALVGFVVVSGTVETDYRVSARAAIEGTVQQAVVAPQDGYIAAANARAGDTVKANDVLATLDDRELVLERERWATERDKHAREHQEALASGDRARVSILAARVAQANAQLRLVEERLRRTQLRSPFDGVVVSGDLSQALGAPTQRGQVLFEVAPLDGYRVALQIDEHDISHVRTGQLGSVRLTGLPETPLDVKVERITPLAVAEEGQNHFRVEARLETPPAELRPGMEGIAKVAVERGSLLWVWTHELVARLRLWAWSAGI